MYYGKVELRTIMGIDFKCIVLSTGCWTDSLKSSNLLVSYYIAISLMKIYLMPNAVRRLWFDNIFLQQIKQRLRRIIPEQVLSSTSPSIRYYRSEHPFSFGGSETLRQKK